MEWAIKDKVFDTFFFETSMNIYLLENQYRTPIHDSVHFTRRFEYPWVYGTLPLSGNILDVGAGATAFQILISRETSSVTSIDVDNSAVNWVNQTGVKNVKSIRGGFPKLPFADCEFDNSYCISVLEHISKDQVLQSINELRRVTKGSVVITMDVSIGPCDRQVNLVDFYGLAEKLDFSVPDIPTSAIKFVVDGYSFVVACINLSHDTSR